MTTRSYCACATATWTCSSPATSVRRPSASWRGQDDRAPLRILKVAHHGSRTSSSGEFIERYAPHVALVSAGRGNPFGHPAPEVARAPAIASAPQIFRTDRDGAVIIETDGRDADRALDARPRVDDARVADARLTAFQAASSSSADASWTLRPCRVSEPFDVVETPRELVVCVGQRGFRLDAELSREVREREQQVA